LINFFSFITHAKVAKIVLSGELANSKPFGNFVEGLFLFFINYFSKKEGFLDRFVVYSQECIKN